MTSDTPRAAAPEGAEVLAADLARLGPGLYRLVAEWMIEHGWTEPLDPEPPTDAAPSTRAISEKHVPSMYDGSWALRAQVCMGCHQVWPCDTKVLLDEAEEAPDGPRCDFACSACSALAGAPEIHVVLTAPVEPT